MLGVDDQRFEVVNTFVVLLSKEFHRSCLTVRVPSERNGWKVESSRRWTSPATGDGDRTLQCSVVRLCRVKAVTTLATTIGELPCRVASPIPPFVLEREAALAAVNVLSCRQAVALSDESGTRTSYEAGRQTIRPNTAATRGGCSGSHQAAFFLTRVWMITVGRATSRRSWVAATPAPASRCRCSCLASCCRMTRFTRWGYKKGAVIVFPISIRSCRLSPRKGSQTRDAGIATSMLCRSRSSVTSSSLPSATCRLGCRSLLGCQTTWSSWKCPMTAGAYGGSVALPDAVCWGCQSTPVPTVATDSYPTTAVAHGVYAATPVRSRSCCLIMSVGVPETRSIGAVA